MSNSAFRSLLLFFLFSCFYFPLPGQRKKIDSLVRLLKASAEDTVKVNRLNILSSALKSSAPDSSRILSEQALKASIRLGWKKGEANSLQNVGISYYYMTNYPEALKYYDQALRLFDELLKSEDDLLRRFAKKGKATTLGNIGAVYMDQGEYSRSIAYLGDALKMNEEIGFELGIANNTGSIGFCYAYQGLYPRALQYYFKALKIYEKLGYQNGVGRLLTLIGTVYYDQKDREKARTYYEKALDLYKRTENKDGIASNVGNLGNLYKEWAEDKKTSAEDKEKYIQLALENYSKALAIYNEMNNRGGKAILYGNIGLLYYLKKDKAALKYFSDALEINLENSDMYSAAFNYKNLGIFYGDQRNKKDIAESEKYLLKSLQLFHEIGSLQEESETEVFLSQLYEKNGRHEEAFIHFKNATKLRDSVFNAENKKELVRKEMQFEFDKKQTADSVRVAEEKKVAAAELKAEKNKGYTLYGGLGSLLVFAGFIFNRFRVTQKQKVIIEGQKKTVEEQKRLVETKQKEILDSINYARRIQMAQIPNENLMNSLLKKTKS